MIYSKQFNFEIYIFFKSSKGIKLIYNNVCADLWEGLSSLSECIGTYYITEFKKRPIQML